MEDITQKVRNLLGDGKNYMARGKTFKEKHPFSKRQSEACRILEEYPNRIPVICECNGTGLPAIDRKKYLVPFDLSMAQFLYVIRKRIKIKPEQSIYLFVGDASMVAGSQLIGTVYEKQKDLDGFLYTTYSGENTFG